MLDAGGVALAYRITIAIAALVTACTLATRVQAESGPPPHTWDELGVPPGCERASNAAEAKQIIASCTLGLEGLTTEAKAWTQYLRGYAYVELKAYDKAYSELRAAIAQAPSVETFHTELAFVLIEFGDYDGGERAAARAMKLRPGSIRPLRERAYARLLKGDYYGSLEDSSAAIASDSDAVSRAVRAFTRALLGDVDGAREDLTELPKVTDSTTKEWSDLARLVLTALEEGNTGADATAICYRTPKDIDNTKDKVTPCTRAAFQVATDKADRARALRYRSTAWLYGHDWKLTARADAEAAVRLEPGDPNNWAQRGWVLMSIGGKRNLRQAIADTKRAMEIMGARESETTIRINLADALLANGDAAAALREVEVFLARKPDNASALWTRGSARIALFDTERGKADLTAAWALGIRQDSLKEELEAQGIDVAQIKSRRGN